jgi:hypothetical protein
MNRYGHPHYVQKPLYASTCPSRAIAFSVRRGLAALLYLYLPSRQTPTVSHRLPSYCIGMTTAALQFHQQEAFESAAELRRLQGKLERAQSEVRQHCGTVIAARESEAPLRALI